MPEKEFLTKYEYIGTVLPDEDPTHRGWYKVYVPVLQPHMKDDTGIWCQNHTCKYRVSPSQAGVSGSYIPLQAGMSVVVKCFANDIESAYIDRVISDQFTNSLPFEIIERDSYYQVIRTPKHDNLIAIYESDTASQNIPKNSIHVYFNSTRTVVVIDETGINIKTDDNTNVTITGDCKIKTTGTANIYATGNANIQSAADINIKSASNLNLEASTINIKGKAVLEGAIHLNGAVKSLNLHDGDAVKATSGPDSATSAGSAAQAVAPSLITLTDYEYFTRSSGG